VTSETVYISRRAAAVATYLRSPFVDEFRQATANQETVSDIRQPYQRWFLDITTIPENARARYVDINTGRTMIREIPYNI